MFFPQLRRKPSLKQVLVGNHNHSNINHHPQQQPKQQQQQQQHNNHSGKESFTALVRRRDFDALRKKLDASYDPQLQAWLLKSFVPPQQHHKKNHHPTTTIMTTTPLHFILPFHPPLDVVELLLDCLVEMSHCHYHHNTNNNNHFDCVAAVPEEARDAAGRTPLHIAVAANCHVTVVDRLLQGAALVMPAVARDTVHQRLPLHEAVADKTDWHHRGPGPAAVDNIENHIDVVYLLLNHYALAVTLTDKHGKTPLAYAVQNPDIDERVVDVMKEATAAVHDDVHHQQQQPKQQQQQQPQGSSPLSSSALPEAGCEGGKSSLPKKSLLDCVIQVNHHENQQQNSPQRGYFWNTPEVDVDDDQVSSLGAESHDAPATTLSSTALPPLSPRNHNVAKNNKGLLLWQQFATTTTTSTSNDDTDQAPTPEMIFMAFLPPSLHNSQYLYDGDEKEEEAKEEEEEGIEQTASTCQLISI